MIPLFSIIVPVYNIKEYISRCIDSIISQSFNEWELILVDDGSTDGTGDVCEQYKMLDSRITVIHQNKTGVSAARNTGMKIARGEYVVFLDGDDYWDRTDVFDSELFRSDYDIIYLTKTILEYPKGVRLIKDRTNNFTEKTYKGDILDFLPERIVGGWGCVFFFVRRTIVVSYNIFFDEKTMIGEDVDWVLRIAEKARNLGIIDSSIYVYSVNRVGSAMTHKSFESIMSFFSMVNKWNLIRKNNKTADKAYILLCSNAVHYFPTLICYPRSERFILLKSLKKTGAIENCRGKKAERIKRGISFWGENRYLVISGVFYLLRLYAWRIKGLFY